MLEKKIDASVIIPTYNRAKELGLTLASLEKQNTGEYVFEVIVSDDGSSDNTKEIVDGYSDQLSITYLFQDDTGYRCTIARNNGIKAAKGEICIFIDSGVLLAKDAIKRHIERHRQESVDCLLTGYVVANSPLDQERLLLLQNIIDHNTIEDAIMKAGVADFKDSRERLYKLYGYEIHEWPAPWTAIYGCDISTRRDFAVKIGMFDENFDSWGCDDNEFGLRAQLNGAKLILDKDNKGIYYPHDSGNLQKKDPQKFIEGLDKNKRYIYSKFPLEAVRLWIEYPYYEVNRRLAEQEEGIKK